MSMVIGSETLDFYSCRKSRVTSTGSYINKSGICRATVLKDKYLFQLNQNNRRSLTLIKKTSQMRVRSLIGQHSLVTHNGHPLDTYYFVRRNYKVFRDVKYGTLKRIKIKVTNKNGKPMIVTNNSVVLVNGLSGWSRGQ